MAEIKSGVEKDLTWRAEYLCAPVMAEDEGESANRRRQRLSKQLDEINGRIAAYHGIEASNEEVFRKKVRQKVRDRYD